MPDRPTLNPSYWWGPASIYKLPTKEFLAGIPSAYQIGTAEEIAMRRVGYVPSYFEHPQNLVEAYQKWQSLPKGVSAPDWLDTDKLDQAYQYLKFFNQDKPWTEWSYLNPKDVLGRSLLQSLGTPPVQVMSPSNAEIYGDAGAVMKGEMNWSDLAPDSRAKLLSDPTFDIAKYPWQIRPQILADPNWDWSKLPAWQKTYYGVMSSPLLPMAMAALPAGLIGLSVGGPVGGAIGAGVGAYAGWKASQGAYDPTKEFYQQQPTFLGNVFAGLNWPVDQAERLFGLMEQIKGAIMEPEAHPIEEIFSNLPASYQAGLSYFEQWFPMLTGGKEYIIGEKEPVQLTIDAYDRLEIARKQIEAGRNPREIALEMQQYVGAQMGDLLLQIVADPLNVLPWAGKTMVSKGLEITGHPTAAGAMAGSRGIVEGVKTYATRVQTGMVAPSFKYNEMSGLSQFFAGITIDAEGKPVIRAGRFAGTGMLEEPTKGFINYLSTLDPESRARLGLGMASENVLTIMSMFDNPEDVAVFWNKVRAGDYESAAAMSAHFVQSPEFYTVLPAIKNFTMDGLINVWRASRPNAAVIERIAVLLGETGETVIKDLATPEAAARMFERIRSLVETSTDPTARLLAEEITKGTFTPDDLLQAGKIFNGDARAPLTSAQWKATAADAMTTHFAEWAKNFFHLQPDSAFFRAAAMMKTAQSLLLLGFNPNYTINNSLNDIVSRVATGNFGYMTPGQIATYIDRLGIAPYRLMEGVGMVGEVTARAPERLITDALRANKGVIANTHNFLRSTGSKLGVFSNLSRWIEKVEGANAYVSGIKRAWGQIWRLDKGYSRMDPELVNTLEAVHPGASRLIYDAIQAGGMNHAVVERIVLQGARELHTRSLVNNVAQSLGIDPSQAVTMLDEIGVLDDLDVRLTGVKSEEGIRAAFKASAKKAQDWIDVRLADEFETRASQVANRLNTEGWQAVADIYIDTELKVQERWLEHYNAFEDAFAQLDTIDDPVLRGNILESTYLTQAREWARVNHMELSAYKGLAKGLGLGELPEARDFLARKSEIQNLWGDAYKFRMDETAKYTDRFKDNWADPARYVERDSLQKRINQKFEATFKEVQKNERAMGDVFAAQFRQRFGESVGNMAGKYWIEITSFRAKMWQEMQTFRKSLEGMTYDQRRAASQQFWHERYPVLINELEHMKMLGANEIRRTITGRPPEEGAAPAPIIPPPTEPTGGAGGAAVPFIVTHDMRQRLIDLGYSNLDVDGMNPTQAWDVINNKRMSANKVAQVSIFAIANEFGVPSADANGNPLFGANLHILAIVRKYGGDEGALIKTFADLADKPDLVRAAFEQRRIVKNQQIPMPEFATDAQMAEYQVVRNTAAAMVENPELAAAAVVESELLKVPRESADVAAAKAFESVVTEPPRWEHIEKTHIAILTSEIRDALMYKAWDMMTLVEAGEAGQRLFDDGGFVGATKSSYPDWYGPLRRNKGDVVFALEALSKGLDKPEQGLYRSLKGIAAELLTSDPALLEKWEWAKSLGAENEILYRWDRSVDEIERTVRVIDINDPFADKMIGIETLIELMDGLPEEVYDLVPEWKQHEGLAETYRDHISRVFDEAEAKIRAITDRRAMLERLVSADKESAAVQQFRDMVMTRESFREQLVEQFGLPAEQADAQINVMDAQAQAWAKWTGKKPEAWYEQYLSQVVRGGKGELFQVDNYNLREARVDYKNNPPIDRTTGMPRNRNLANQAIEHFGETFNPAEAGYILDDGRMVDFSGKRVGGRPGTRALDHRDIGSLDLPDIKEISKQGTSDVPMTTFAMETGAIRASFLGKDLLIDVFARIPSPEQLALIRGLLDDGTISNIIVDFSTGRGDTIGSFEVKSVSQLYDLARQIFEGDQPVYLDEEGMLFQQGPLAPVWYSKLGSVITDKMPNRADVALVRGLLEGAGVKADELKWTGMDTWLAEQKGMVSKADVIKYLQENQVQVQEVTKGGQTFRYSSAQQYESAIMRAERAGDFNLSEQLTREQEAWVGLPGAGEVSPTKFAQYTEPGGTNYREILFTLPGGRVLDYRAPHWEEPNVLAHVRLDDRIDAEGKRVLFIEEVQSDWHQAGREQGYMVSLERVELKAKLDPIKAEYNRLWTETQNRLPGRTLIEIDDVVFDEHPEIVTQMLRLQNDLYLAKEGVPTAPFAKTWPDLVMKRVIRMAAEEGYDRVAWTTGEMQAARYDLAKQVDYITSLRNADGTYNIGAIKDGNDILQETGRNLTPQKMADTIGKELAKKIVDDPDNIKEWRGEDLKVGGEGMKGFYDTILPGTVQKYVKKWGAKVGETEIAITDLPYKVHSFDITDSMMQSVLYEGQPLFQEGLPPAIGAKGAISFTDQGKAIIHALDGADFSTAVHEIGGHLFPEILRQAVNDALPEFKPQLEADLRTLEDWAGIAEGSEWTIVGREKLARGFERYVTEGVAPLPTLVRVFERMKTWMLEIYKAIIASAIDVNLTDEVRAVFDRMLGKEAPTGKAYDGLRPGTPEWMDTWRAHPELQGEMSAVAQTMQDAVVAKAAEVSVFGEKPPTQQTTLFQNVDPRTPLGYYEQAAGWLPKGAVLDEAWAHYVKPLLDGMQNEALRQYREPPFSMGELDTPTQTALNKYLNQKKGERATSKLAAIRYGESMRDFALLNYNRRYGFDKYLDVFSAYQFWYTRTMLNWGMRGLDRPAWFANYARLNMAQNRYANNLPERMRGKIRIPAPWLPDWMGDELFIDPKRSIFPFFSMVTPFEKMMQDQNYQVIEAERILQEWSQDESISQVQLLEAWQKRSGATWEKALAEAKVRRQSDISDPLDFLSILLSPSWYLSMPAKALGLNIPYINPQGGGPETISETPLTRTARAMEAVTAGTWVEPIGQLIGLLGKPETWIRKQTGLPAYGEYGDYYVKRQIANMVSDGLISVQEAEQAMLERKGDIYDQARKRVELELAMRVPGAAATYAALHGGIKAGVEAIPMSLFGAQILPAGELKYRGLYEKWNAAWDAYDAGDTNAVNQFFNDHPEYEAYLAKNKDEGELLRSFLIGQIWDSYMAMDKNNRKILLAQMPAIFEQSFLDNETRSYDAIDTQTLAMWARVFKGVVPETPVTETVIKTPQYQMPQLLEIPLPLQNALDAYNLAKTQNFPNINEVQSIYFALPKERRRKILTLYPQLLSYWDWRRNYIEEHPEVAQFIDSDTMTAILNDEIAPMGMNADQAQKILRYYRAAYFDETPVRTYDYYMEKASETLKMQFLDYVLRGTPLGDGAMKELISIWEANGKPQGLIDNWVSNLLIPTMP